MDTRIDLDRIEESPGREGISMLPQLVLALVEIREALEAHTAEAVLNRQMALSFARAAVKASGLPHVADALAEIPAPEYDVTQLERIEQEIAARQESLEEHLDLLRHDSEAALFTIRSQIAALEKAAASIVEHQSQTAQLVQQLAGSLETLETKLAATRIHGG